MVTRDNLGLFYIISPISSHWTTCYFIRGSRGVSVVRWTGTGRAPDDVRAALAKHQADFSPEEAERMIHYFDK
ncbi:hypothetical protein EJV47_12640 [Hymenobacter gummosus]|uniref:Uncharacterized protein n=1 Tax=Hymenobacter gummosus TaxID=1776032 RepID=A0A431U313_9BACT|nr:hypothetical protein [Hymenobacter gummosus]RTQ49659.1 hypothetical protein EJV47_12640 [Hymenobacter gummosus]